LPEGYQKKVYDGNLPKDSRDDPGEKKIQFQQVWGKMAGRGEKILNMSSIETELILVGVEVF